MIKALTKTKFLPLCVDLDGTLIFNDVTWVSLGIFIQRNPLKIAHLLGWIMKSRALLKHELAQAVDLDANNLKYNKKLIDYITDQPHEEIYLVTAADQKMAQAVADHLGLFKGVIASDGATNLRAQAKADKLIEIFGEKQFIYAGNSRDDLYVWKHAAAAIPINTNADTDEKLKLMKVDVIKI